MTHNIVQPKKVEAPVRNDLSRQVSLESEDPRSGARKNGVIALHSDICTEAHSGKTTIRQAREVMLGRSPRIVSHVVPIEFL